ncbi:MAG TPA: DNA-binding protein [Nitrospirota bacterium]|nr:DNA-binding protein [Nitrospirota bacterium]
MKLSRKIVITAASFIALSAISAFAASKQEGPSAPPSPAGKEQIIEKPSTISGKVVETMNAGGYTYVCVEKAGKKTWVAVPAMQVTVGQQVSFTSGQEMTNFTSKTLNRTFESIVFSGGPADVKTSSHSGEMPAGAGSGSKAAVSPLEKGVKIEKAAGTNAYTVAEIFTKAKSLNKKQVLVRAKVVKVSKGIMNRNWIHLQDGTGDAGKGTHNLVATSQGLPATGDVITVKGTVIKDKDFGSGYKYAVILEDATVQP